MISLSMRCLIFIFLFFQLIIRSEGQIIDNKSSVSFSAGKVMFTGNDNLFFPKRINSSSYSFRGDYLHTVHPWIKLGIEGSLIMPQADDQMSNEFSKIDSNNEKIITAGINTTFNLPYKASGWRNRLRLQFGIAPVAVFHLGERVVTFDNEVWNIEDQISEGATLTMKGPSTGFGLSLTPSIEYYITQRVGLKVSANSLLTSMKGDLITEDLMIYSFNFGIFIPLSKDKKMNY